MTKQLRVFIDTEFTDFLNRDLISIGLVTETGDEFYGECLDYKKSWASDFVKQNVLPLCDFKKHGKNRAQLHVDTWKWINELPCDEIILMIDYRGDHELLVELFDGEHHPKIKEVQNIFVPLRDQFIIHSQAGLAKPRFIEDGRKEYKLGFLSYFLDTKETQHHALSDAKANARGFNRMMQHIGLSY